ncbi:hypothetical protein RGQ15_16615 [Paracoccus sp. MBLB3053]|uniref:Branched-chain amino acid ATP-binding cassette transporter C-terminal domain-containing protein n=1 Tax=Paracoccus aurantius TaxID=3073814 RepID=A0ABU2HXD5_9RHOB|nr:hypothetical protein [Paracoccus sp. MBLB3053]MDS9469185.1 hypothetical protein [Paracoccus sp. MBLB3053]
MLLVLVLGGVGYLYGGLIGASDFKLLQDLFSAITPQYWMFWMGLVLLLDEPAADGTTADIMADPRVKEVYLGSGEHA